MAKIDSPDIFKVALLPVGRKSVCGFPKSDQFHISPAASPETLYHTV